MNPELQTQRPLVPETPSETQILDVENINQLNDLLKKYGINTDKWTKSSEKLLTEIKDGETILKVVDSQLERHTNTALITVLSPDGLSKLVEDRQEFRAVTDKDGSVTKEAFTKRRGLTELAEKFKAGENAEEVARRALTEELGYPKDSTIFGDVEIRPLPNPVNNEVPKSAYQGLKTVNNLKRFLVRMPDNLYKEEGYTEVQEEKINYMQWKPITEIKEEKRQKELQKQALALQQATEENQLMDNFMAGDQNASETAKARGLI
jgi:8-oxo-dGTP pyrophosphatase MutT (NUDIX family)